MIIAAHADNLLTDATVLTSDALFELGATPSNLTDPDPRKSCVPRGTFTIEAGNNDTIDGNDGAGFVATIAAGTYSSAQELGVATMTALNSASSAWHVYQSQESATRGQWYLLRTAGTASLDPTVSTSALRYVFGFRAEARTAAASHLGDFAAIHSARSGVFASSTSHRQDVGVFDLGSAKPSTCCFLAGIDASPGAIAKVSMGSSAAASSVTWIYGEHAEDEVVYIPTNGSNYRYFRASLTDPRRPGPRLAIGSAWLGVAFDTDRSSRSDHIEWEWSSYQRSLTKRSVTTRTKDGSLIASEVEPVEVFSVGFQNAPGLSPALMFGLRKLLRSLGNSALCYVCFDTSRPGTTSRLCRYVGSPVFAHVATQSQSGRWSLSLQFEAEPVR